jgi:hypothetical protein
MLISGAIPFKNKKEKLAAWRDLKKEFGDSVKVIIKDGIISYTAKVERGFI